MDLDVPVSRLMTPDPVTVDVGETLAEARRAMTEGGFHHVPVVSGGRLVGLLSSTDLLRVAYGYAAVPLQTDAAGDGELGIRTLMSRDLVYLRTDSTVARAVELLADRRFHSLPVVDEDGKLVGLVTTSDIVRFLVQERRQIASS
jgi:CBS domain-containing protein